VRNQKQITEIEPVDHVEDEPLNLALWPRVPTPLTVEQVCALYTLHPKTVQRLARRGEMPAFKVGKNWRFYDVDLIAHFRAQSTPLVLEGAHAKEIKPCHFTKEKTPHISGVSSPSKASSYNSLLGL
jgi:excisionase family DNA binding protein